MIYLICGISIALITLVVLQSKGNGLSIVPWSGDFGKFEKRGAEKAIHNVTIALIVAFVAVALFIYLVG